MMSRFSRAVPFLIFILIASSCELENQPPEISGVSQSPEIGVGGEIFTLMVEASDVNKDQLTYLWTADEGRFIDGDTTSQVQWESPILQSSRSYTIGVSVSDGAETVSFSHQIDAGISKVGSVAGVVYFEGCRIPIADVRISIADRTVTTGVDGAFKIDNIPFGSYTFQVSKDGFTMYSKELFIPSGSTIELFPQLVSELFTTKVFGKISDLLTNSPKGGVSVVMMNPDGSDSNLRATSDSLGYYQIPNIPQGEQILTLKVSSIVLKSVDIFPNGQEYSMDIPVEMSFFDIRDGHSYDYLTIGTQTWMIENLNFDAAGWGTRCYGDSISNCDKYGRLYDFPTASGYRFGNKLDVCPPNWHLPSDEEWAVLENYLGEDAGEQLKSTSGWKESNRIDGGNGNNYSGFNALPTGFIFCNGVSMSRGDATIFWTSSADSTNAWIRSLEFLTHQVRRDSIDLIHTFGYSVRCIRD